ncbi:hypothetical protein IMCC9480_580 [Oxalobacteraceae bacterium IMCC9480]|nr:hypothetical protein IMCC9480_580 [Oxalobacteraceae bacterium IMCC9480]NDP59720.1 hypothetical protein [Oxalobacteraceae bacterium]
MKAQIFKKDKDFDSSETLKINDKNIAFFTDPVIDSSFFYSSKKEDKWHLIFFDKSFFKQELFVDFSYVGVTTEKTLGVACWLNNKGVSANNSGLRADASKFLRDSNTLSLDQGREITSNRLLITDRSGLAYFSDNSSQFKRIVLCQSLAIAYTGVLHECMTLMTSYVKDKSTEKAIELYENILTFNAAYYFSLPVLLTRHELSAVWEILSGHYRLALLNQELTQQLSDVAALLREKRERERINREKDYEQEQRLLRDRTQKKESLQKKKEEKQDKRRTFWFSLVAILLAAISLLSLAQLTPAQLKENTHAWQIWWSEPSSSIQPDVLRQLRK